MNRQVAVRRAGLGGALYSVARGVQYAYRHRSAIQQAGATARSVIDRAAEFLRNRGSATTSTTSTRSSNLGNMAVFRSSRRRLGRRFLKKKNYRKRRIIKKRKFGKRRFRKGGTSFKRVIKYVDSLFPWRQAVGTNGTTLTCSVGNLAVGSFECGNYDPGSYGIGAGPFSAFSTYGVNNKGDINNIVNISQNNAHAQVEVEKCMTDVQISNASNSPVILRMYTCRWRRSEASANNMRLWNLWDIACTSDGITSPYSPSATPFHSPTFCSKVKILKSREIRLGSGEQTSYKVVSPLGSKRHKRHNWQALIDEPITPKWTRGVLIFMHGIPSHAVEDHNSVSIGPGKINCVVKGIIRWRFASSGTPVTTHFYNQLPTGLPGGQEIPVGNSNNPQVFMQ